MFILQLSQQSGETNFVKKLVGLLVVLFILIVCAGAGAYFYLRQQFRI
jgi:hypothetical protein